MCTVAYSGTAGHDACYPASTALFCLYCSDKKKHNEEQTITISKCSIISENIHIVYLSL